MHHKQAFQTEHKSGCGPMGRGRFGDSWGRGKFRGFYGRHAGHFAQPPVNIEESDADYVISLFAAGLTKEKVTLTIKDDVLTIAYPGADAGVDQRVEPESATQGKYTYQEYNQGAFERSFRLNNKVITESISASYADGILKVILPKDPATNTPPQTITVA